jgi:diacylglycerol kinase family enzyme
VARWYVALLGVVSLAVIVVAAWYVVSRRGVTRAVAAGVATLALLAFLAVMITSRSVLVLVVGLALAAVSVGAARFALNPAPTTGVGERASAASRPVLLINLKSGGGKAERFRLVDLCQQLGIEPVVLRPGDDLRELAESAADRGADVIGMAGGDGSQALVASVASRHRLPFVVVPAGTRNHFALDLGLNRDDVPGALDAYLDGVDTVVDLAEVNGRIFVNNASMGVYAKVVQSGDYRDAKLQTAAALLPDLVGPAATPFDLRFSLLSGQEVDSAELLLVSNNPYQVARLRGGGAREHLDGGVLGIAFAQVASAVEAERLAALETAGRLQHFPRWQQWTAPEFEVRSSGPVEIGVDGEALTLQPPLRFRTHPGALTVRMPRRAGGSGVAHARLMVTVPTVVALWQTLLGRPIGSR